jgi:general secretion pathway protein D
VDNNQIIVLGGLIDEDTQEVISKVPVLGSIPLLGRLFQSTSSTTNKKNLMVFLKPTILTDSDSSEEVSLEKYNFIRAQKELNEKLDIIDLTKSKD